MKIITSFVLAAVLSTSIAAQDSKGTSEFPRSAVAGVAQRVDKHWEVVRHADVAERDARVANHAIPLRPHDRAALEAGAEGRFLQRKQADEPRARVIQVRRDKVRVGFMILRANRARIKAGVATEHPVAKLRPQLTRD